LVPGSREPFDPAAMRALPRLCASVRGRHSSRSPRRAAHPVWRRAWPATHQPASSSSNSTTSTKRSSASAPRMIVCHTKCVGRARSRDPEAAHPRSHWRSRPARTVRARWRSHRHPLLLLAHENSHDRSCHCPSAMSRPEAISAVALLRIEHMFVYCELWPRMLLPGCRHLWYATGDRHRFEGS